MRRSHRKVRRRECGRPEPPTNKLEREMMYTVKEIGQGRNPYPTYVVIDETGMNVAIGNDIRAARLDVPVTFGSLSGAQEWANKLTARRVENGVWHGRSFQ